MAPDDLATGQHQLLDATLMQTVLRALLPLGPGIGSAAEPRELIVRLDALNVLNRTNDDRIVGVMSSPLFGLPNSARTPRSIQASLRFRF